MLGGSAVPVQIPIGAEKDFQGVVDLIENKAYTYEMDGNGKGKAGTIPAEMADVVEVARQELLEAVAETDEALLNEYLENMDLPRRSCRGPQEGPPEGRDLPVLCTSGLHNMGTDKLMDFLVSDTPSPVDRAELHDNGPRRRSPIPIPSSLFVFKTSADAFAGRLTYFKVASGVLQNDETVDNHTRGGHEKFARIACPQGKELEHVSELHAGDWASWPSSRTRSRATAWA